MENENFEQLGQELIDLLNDLLNEQQINSKKLESVSPGDYSYGEGMHDGLRYATSGLTSILRRHGLIS